MFSESPRVVRISDRIPGAVIVDRTSQWGNPFVIGKDGNRDEVCDRFEAYAKKRVAEDPEWIKPLVGKDLACHCAPKRCHAQTLLRLASDCSDPDCS